LSGETIIEPSRSTPVYGEFDVVVVGGGPAGIMAASAAARAGCSTLLIERYGFLGGAGTAGGLSTFCGLHARTHGADVRVIRGLADELLDRLGKLDGLNAPHLTIADGIAAQAFDISAYKIAADELVTGSGARILFHALAVGVVMKNGGGLGAHRASSSGPGGPPGQYGYGLGGPRANSGGRGGRRRRGYGRGGGNRRGHHRVQVGAAGGPGAVLH
jgi:hypothetical protein